MAEPYNPLEKYNLGKSVVDALLASQPTRLDALRPFDGVGIYAIYYHGSFEPYQSISASDETEVPTPIYVRKAIPAGSRKGASLTASMTGRSLFRRIREHRDSIAAAQNLTSEDFSVRYLAVDDIWIPLGEALLISMFNPVWNHVIDGFGNHTPGAGRFEGTIPLWDVLHPGRSWAAKCQPREETREELGRRVIEYLSTKQR